MKEPSSSGKPAIRIFNRNSKITMKTYLLLIILSVSASLNAQHQEIKPYVDFLKTQNTSAKDYLIGLFDRYDIVIFSERNHKEQTQYELLREVFADPRFSEKSGHIFMEMGGSNFDRKINDYLHQKKLSESESRRKAIEIQRNSTWYPLWDSYNYHYLLTELYKINSALPAKSKLSLHPTDMPVNWSQILTKEDVVKNIRNKESMIGRDSVMAANIISKIKSLETTGEKRRKYFIILNSAHSLKHEYVLMNFNVKPAAASIFEHFPGRTANVLINMEAVQNLQSTSNLGSLPPILDGKWDAAFTFVKKDDFGFDLSKSPIADSLYQNMPLREKNVKNAQAYTGYVYYRHLPNFMDISGFEGLLDDIFNEELYRRRTLFYGPATIPKHEVMQWFNDSFNRKNSAAPSYVADYWTKVTKWIKKPANDKEK